MNKRSTRTTSARGNQRRTKLPEHLRPLFWDYPFGRLRWETDAPFVINRILARGSFGSLKWLRRKIGDEGLRQWITQHRGRGLGPDDLAFWQVVLELPKKSVKDWLQDPGRKVWDERRGRQTSTRKFSVTGSAGPFTS